MIFSKFERMVAFRYLRPRRQEGFVSVIAIFSLLGIMLGVATLIIVMSVMNGFRIEFVSRILGLNGHLAVYGAGASMTDFDAMAAKVRAVPGVVSATPLIEAQSLATTDAGGAAGIVVRGIRPEDIKARKLISDHIVAGLLNDFHDDQIAVGDRLAKRLGVGVGGLLTVVSPQGEATAFGTIPRMKTYKIAALFDVGFYEYDNNFVYVPLDAAQVFYRLKDAVSYLEVFVGDADEAAYEGRLISAALGDHVRILDWQRSNSSIVAALDIQSDVMFLILTLIIVVAAFNIISGMTMVVKDKGRDIAILRTMGASRGMILRIFMMSGASIGVAGTLAGFALGIVFTENIEAIREFVQDVLHMNVFAAEIYYFTHIPAKIIPNQVATVVIMALVLSFLATLYPAWRAARLDPVEGLRYE